VLDILAHWLDIGGGRDNTTEDQDPRVADEPKLNLALCDDSRAYSLQGFRRIPFEQIGRALTAS
jgi:hypothetical protein